MSASNHCALRAPTMISARIKTIRAEITVMQLLRNNCHIRADGFSSAQFRNSATTGGAT